MTPLSARRAKSATSTPAQGEKQAQGKGDQLRQKLFFAPLTEEIQTWAKDIESPLIASPLHFHGMSNRESGKGGEKGGKDDGEGGKDDREVVVGHREGGKDDGEGGKHDGEVVMSNVLGEELDNLQEANRDLQKQLEVVLY